MAKFPLSKDQQSVVDSRGQNILVSAAAGSGKTRVLTERIIGRVCDANHPIDIDRILVVTFTNSAAREMKDRISTALSERIAANPFDSHLEKQATLIHNAQITTIDSFCLYLFRNNFHRIDADPSLRVMNEGEKELLMQETMDDVIKRAYESGDKDFHHIVDCYSKKDKDDSLEGSIRKLFNYAGSYPWPVKWLNDRRKDYGFESLDDFKASAVLDRAYESALEYLRTAENLCNKSIEITEEPGGPLEYKETLLADLNIITGLKDKIESREDFDVLSTITAATSFPRIANAKKTSDELLQKRVKKLRERYKALVSGLSDRIFYDTLENIYKDMCATARTVNKLIDLTVDFADSFAAAKKDLGVLDFSDMEHMAVEILIKEYHDDGTYEITDVAKNYRDFFEEVMVDEYQDSNLVQELIIQSISREKEGGVPNRFMVGDVKQSIYSFRMARPQIFMEKLRNCSKDEKAKDRLITLKNNYRSRDCVINSVNALFGEIMSEKRGGVPYDDDARLYKGGSFTEDTPDNITDVIMLESKERVAVTRDLESKLIAAKIKETVGKFSVTDGETKELRPTRYGDIAVLFRSPSKMASSISAAFEEAGIPYHMEGVGDFFEATEVRDVISFLEVLDNPLSDISLYAAMTSFFGRFTDEECAIIKGKSTTGYYYLEKLKDYAENHPEDGKVKAFLELINRYRDMVTYMPIDELLTALYDETGYRHVVSAMPGGKQRLANINLLLTKASEYGATSFYGLFHFLRYIELIKKTDREEGEANIFDENSDAVRIMSIHKSKGLEFPVCVLGGISEKFNDSDASAAFAANVDAGIGAYCIDPVNRIKKRTLQQSLVADKIRSESLGEEIRVLYVAMTRPKEKLIMTGTCPDGEAWISGGEGKEGCYADLMAATVSSYKGIYFKYSVVTPDDLEAAAISETVDKAALLTALKSGTLGDEDTAKRIRERFSFKYSKDYLSRLYIKTTVSKLKLAAMEEDFESHMPFEEKETGEYIPKFAGAEEEVKGTDRGTAYHNLLQLLDFAAFADCKETADYSKVLDSQIAMIKESEKLSEDALSKIALPKIIAFLKTDTAKEMGAAAGMGKLYKEQPFVIGVKASEVEEGFPDTETVLVQGVIDVYYIKDGEAVVLDYKTDRVSEAGELVKRYKTQLDYYGSAISRLTGLPVGQKVIYSFALGTVIDVDSVG